MDPIVELRTRLREYSNAGLRRIGAECDVPWLTLWKIRSGDTKNPTFRTAQRLAQHFDVPLTNRDDQRPEPKVERFLRNAKGSARQE